MYKYMVEIGTLNGGQKRYLVTAKTPEGAKLIAIARYKAQGFNIKGQRIWIERRGRA